MEPTPSTASAEPAPESPDRAASAARADAWPTWEVAGIVAVAILGLLLRVHLFTEAPLFTDNADELQFTWAGLNLIMHHDPYTWSYFPGYPSYTGFSAFGTTYPMVHHWMDHPPLFSYLMGGWVWLLGTRDMLDVSAVQVRVLPVLFSASTVVLVQLVGRQLIGSAAALLGAALLATAPAAILFGRQAEPESAQAVLLLLALLLTVRLARGAGGRWTLAGLVVIAAAAPLMKVPGIAIAGACAVILAVVGRWRFAATVLAGGVVGLALFVVYGAIVDWQQFVHIWTAQVGNRIGVMAGFDFIQAAAGVNRRLRDGWWLLGWVGLGLLMAGTLARAGTEGEPAANGRTNGAAPSLRERRPVLDPLLRADLFLAWPVVAYAAAMLLMAGERQIEQYGWYRQIVYPEVYLAAGWLAWQAVARRSLALMTLLLVLGGATATNWSLGGPNAAWVPHPAVLAAIIAAVLLPMGLLAWRPDLPALRRWATLTAWVTIVLIVAANAVESMWLDRIFFRM